MIKGRKVMGGAGEGEALVSKEPLSFLGGVDPDTGIVVDKQHDLYGKRITGKVLVFPRGKGSTAGPYTIFAMSKRGNAPVAMINLHSEAIIAIGAVMAGIPLVHCLEENPLERIKTGDYVRVNADEGTLEVEVCSGEKGERE
ncbi:MAG: DUF126 domain-containing protein [Deltaproteobacteria bacterium]|nr:DUF126 domain-containing protein [Deltaproteobacteria bacterium]